MDTAMLKVDVSEALEQVCWVEDGVRLRASFRFDPALSVFAGHFPARPLLPGIMEIEMLREALERATGCRYDLLRVIKAKFLAAIRPGDRVVVEAEVRQGQTIKITAVFRAADATAAKISLVLRLRQGASASSLP